MGSFRGPHRTTVLIRNHENRIARRALGEIYESTSPLTLEGPDNVVIVAQTGDIFLCGGCDSAAVHSRADPRRAICDFAIGLNNNTQFAGACFDPDGRTLYVNQ
jgi:hypothetical protein